MVNNFFSWSRPNQIRVFLFVIEDAKMYRCRAKMIT